MAEGVPLVVGRVGVHDVYLLLQARVGIDEAPPWVDHPGVLLQCHVLLLPVALERYVLGSAAGFHPAVAWESLCAGCEGVEPEPVPYPPLAPERHADEHVAHQGHLVCLRALDHVVEGALSALEAHVDVPVVVDLSVLPQGEVAQVEGYSLGPEACPAAVYLPVQACAVHLACRPEDVGVRPDIEPERVRPHIPAPEHLGCLVDGDGGIARQRRVAAAGAIHVEYLKSQSFHTLYHIRVDAPKLCTQPPAVKGRPCP